VLLNSPRIEQMIQDGKLRINLQDAIDLALQNNLDIAIQRYTPWLAEANILRTLSGSPSGGGTISSLASIPSLSFDPQVTTTLSMDDRVVPQNNALLAGIGTGTPGSLATVASHAAIGDLTYSQGFHTGTSFSATFNNTRASTSVTTGFFDPNCCVQLHLRRQPATAEWLRSARK